jgi:hypothetical protein
MIRIERTKIICPVKAQMQNCEPTGRDGYICDAFIRLAGGGEGNFRKPLGIELKREK